MVMASDARPVTEAVVWHALHDVSDPEIPQISVVDLGVVRSVEVDLSGIHVELLPTFVGCPAIDLMRRAVADRLARFERPVEVVVSHAEPWTSDRITERGRRALESSGFAPPLPPTDASLAIALERPVPCPYCGSRRTVLENVFGPTQCRSIRYCTDCRQPFEHFKTI
jgi:ring-1,2-phenylacetyl-CoA epoxidase subunit PaaD